MSQTQEKSVLVLQYTNFGKFDRAHIDGERISRDEFTAITGIDTYDNSGRTWEHRMEQWEQDQFNIEFIERDVS